MEMAKRRSFEPKLDYGDQQERDKCPRCHSVAKGLSLANGDSHLTHDFSRSEHHQAPFRRLHQDVVLLELLVAAQ
jgi:hypothetical protein